MSTHQMVHKRLCEGPATCAQIAESLGKVRSYMAGRMTTMHQLGLVTRTESKPAIYTNNMAMLPADVEAIETMIKVYGVSEVRYAVKQAHGAVISTKRPPLRALRDERAEQASEETSP